MRKGIVKNITDFGVFLDLDGIDGLLHITDMTWKRIKHPSELVQSSAKSSMSSILHVDRDKGHGCTRLQAERGESVGRN